MIVPDWLLYSWFALAGLSTAYVAWDNFMRHTPEERVMKWAWVLITLYMGPIGLALYMHSDKEPAPGTHEQFIRPLWKQGVGSTVHCIAGDTYFFCSEHCKASFEAEPERFVDRRADLKPHVAHAH